MLDIGYRMLTCHQVPGIIAFYLSFTMCEGAGNHLQQGGFTRSVGTGDSICFARVKLVIAVAEYPLPVKSFANIVKGYLHNTSSQPPDLSEELEGGVQSF